MVNAGEMIMKYITAEEREATFRQKLTILLEGNGAEMDITDDGKRYGMHTGVARITMFSEWDKDGNLVKDYCEFDI